MTAPFLIPDDRLRTLSATRQGRVSIAGYNYQCAYAIARLAAMSIRQPVLDLEDWPQQIRYDYGEDLDEVCDNGTIRFTQCKRVATIGQPASLADVLIGFAPKWLWVPEDQRDKLRFRLVCSDSRFAQNDTDNEALSDTVKAEVRAHFVKRLNKPVRQGSDRFQWANDAINVGHDVLFEALWSNLDCVYLSAEVVDSQPAGPRLEAEKEALRALLEWACVDTSAHAQTQVLGRLRRLIHDNLIKFEPTNELVSMSISLPPRVLNRADVEAAINPWRPATHRQPPFRLVDRTFLSEQRELERKQFVARQPEWCDLVHGPDKTVKFIERDQTAALEREVVERVVERIGAEKLPALFVVGAPGDGKTTITRRVAARLVEAGTVLIADTGVGLQEPPGDPDEYVDAIERIQDFGRPVVLLLDDPLYAGSAWLDVLRKINRPNLRVGVLAASPQFLLDEHESELKTACKVERFSMDRISQGEREALAAVHGRSVTRRSEEDFLVVAMETAADVPFSQIIDRMWLTLAHGRDLSSARTLSDLPWEIRAYLFVCFFSQAYEACPEPLLQQLLEATGGVSSTTPVAVELARMKYFTGWRIFRIGQATREDRSGRRVWATRKAQWTWANMDYEGAPIATAHTVIARQAWEQRPLRWCDVDEAIVEASLAVPRVIRDVASLAVRLSSSGANKTRGSREPGAFANRLIDRWRLEPTVETQHLVRLLFSFTKLDRAQWVQAFRQVLFDRAVVDPELPDRQAWMAAHRLYFLALTPDRQWGFPPQLDLGSIIQVADFSLWPSAATHFGKLLEPYAQLRDLYVSRLVDALDGKTDWQLNSLLLTYLITIAPQDQLSSRTARIEAWLDEQPENQIVRVQYLSFLLKLPQELAYLREAAAWQTKKWLDEHPEDNFVRTQYLSFLLRLPAEFSSLREATAQQTQEWLENHPQDSYVRMKYLSFLLKLPANSLSLRQAAAPQTEKWLGKQLDDSDVRTQYLAFVFKLPAEFFDVKEAVIQQTAKWLKHRDDRNVRTQFLRCLAKMQSLNYWRQLARLALNDTMSLVVRSGYTWKHQALISAAGRIHNQLLSSLRVEYSDAVRTTLRRSHYVANHWYRKNNLEPQPEFPFP